MNEELLHKYLSGTSTRHETQLVEEWILESKENTAYFNRLKSKFIVGTFEDTSKRIATDKAFRDFESRHVHKSIPVFRRLRPKLGYAALILILLTSGYFLYIHEINQKKLEIPDDAITLELQDGTIEIIAENGSTRIVDTNGKVLGRQKGKQLIYDKENTQKELAFNTLTVPYGKTFELQLSDGTTAHLNSGSSFTYPVSFLKGQNREVSITGECYLDVANDSLRPFIVNADKLNVRVLGTQFNVSAYPEDTTSEVVLVEGSVGLYEKSEMFHSGRTVMLKPGFKGKFDKKDNQITKDKVIPSIYTSWMSGELVFREMTLENILKKLERHYNVVIENNNKELSKKEFNANFGKEPLTKVLQELHTYYGIKHQKVGDKIIIE